MLLVDLKQFTRRYSNHQKISGVNGIKYKKGLRHTIVLNLFSFKSDVYHFSLSLLIGSLSELTIELEIEDNVKLQTKINQNI